jgi:hypothetical protein
MLANPLRATIAIAFIIGVILALVWLWLPSRTVFRNEMGRRDRRAWLLLGILVGPTLLLLQWNANRVAASAGAAQGLLLASVALNARTQRIVWSLAYVIFLVSMVLALFEVGGFTLAPARTA